MKEDDINKLYANDIIRHIQDVYQINASESLICKVLKEENFVFGKLKRQIILSRRHRDHRLKFAKDNIDRDWSEVAFCDECTIYKTFYHEYGWYKPGTLSQLVDRVRPSIKVN